jgi:hypothetical protein
MLSGQSTNDLMRKVNEYARGEGIHGPDAPRVLPDVV